MSKRYLAALVVILVVAVAPVAAAHNTVIGSPNIELTAAQDHFRSGESATLKLSVSNDGNIRKGGPGQFEKRVKTARNAKFKIKQGAIDADIQVKSGTVLAGDVPEGSLPEKLKFKIEIGKEVDPGRYRIPVKVSYDYSAAALYDNPDSPEYVDRSSSEIKYVSIVVDNKPDFEILNSSSRPVLSGGTGLLNLTLKNTGNQKASDIRMKFNTENQAVSFGSGKNPQSSTSKFVESLEPGSKTRMNVRFTASADAPTGSYPIDAVANYRKPNGVEQKSMPLYLGVEVSSRNRFSVEDISSSLEVGSEGNISGTIRNEGSTTAKNLDLSLDIESLNFNSLNKHSSVGKLRAGETGNFSFRIEVGSEAESGDREFLVNTRYRDPEGKIRHGNSLDLPVHVAGEKNSFVLNASNDSVEQGSTTRMEVEVKNNRKETLRNIQVRVFTDDPLDTSSDKAGFIPKLKSGGSSRIEFDVSASTDSTPGNNSVKLDFRYETPRNETKVTDSYLLPVKITESDESQPGYGAGAAVLAIVSVILLYRKRS
ncbi:MAG: hypothetical protein ABEK59_06205 [Halobacteria archaeon]